MRLWVVVAWLGVDDGFDLAALVLGQASDLLAQLEAGGDLLLDTLSLVLVGAVLPVEPRMVPEIF